jgi:hypothetical protein
MAELKDSIFVLLPLLVAIAFFLLFFFYKPSWGDHKVEFAIPLRILKLSFNVRSIILVRIIFLVFALGCLLVPLFRDYSHLFNTNLSYSVYYDTEEIGNKLNKINSLNQDHIVFANDWVERRVEIFKDLDARIKDYVDIEHYFSFDKIGSYLSSEAKATHKAVFHKQWQNYRITEVSGTMIHTLHAPNSQPIELETRYELKDSNNKYIKFRFGDFLRGRMVIMPEMNQSLLYHSKNMYEIDLTGITIAKIFPFPVLEFTVFCAKQNGEYIPLAYAEFQQ